MTKPLLAGSSSAKLSFAWASIGAATIIETSADLAERPAVHFALVERPDPPSAVDGLIAELGLEAEVRGVRQEMGQALARAGKLSLRSLRLKAGLSQRELGERIGMSQSNVARLERQPGDVGIRLLRKLREALGVDLDTLDKVVP